MDIETEEINVKTVTTAYETLGLVEFMEQGWSERSAMPHGSYADTTRNRTGINITSLDRIDPAEQMTVIGSAFKDMKEPDQASFTPAHKNDTQRMLFIFDATSEEEKAEWKPIALAKVFEGEKVVSI